MADTTKKVCSHCGVLCVHNPMKTGFRCTYCGFPVGGQALSAKRVIAEETCKKQTIKAGKLI